MPTKEKKPLALAYENLRKRCVSPALFQRCTPKCTMEMIKDAITSDDFEWARRVVLSDGFPRTLATAQHRKGDWSFGFCYRIAEVASIILESAGLRYEPWFIEHAKKNVRPPFDSHWILRSNKDGSFFDCAKGASVPTPARKKNGSKPIPKGFFPQHPSKGAMHLFRRIVERSFQQPSKQVATAKQLLADLEPLEKLVRDEWYKSRNLPVLPSANTP